MGLLKMYFLLKMGIFHRYVSLPEGYGPVVLIIRSICSPHLPHVKETHVLYEKLPVLWRIYVQYKAAGSSKRTFLSFSISWLRVLHTQMLPSKTISKESTHKDTTHKKINISANSWSIGSNIDLCLYTKKNRSNKSSKCWKRGNGTWTHFSSACGKTPISCGDKLHKAKILHQLKTPKYSCCIATVHEASKTVGNKRNSIKFFLGAIFLELHRRSWATPRIHQCQENYWNLRGCVISCKWVYFSKPLLLRCVAKLWSPLTFSLRPTLTAEIREPWPPARPLMKPKR